jgi:hypothetical protein
LFWYFRDYLMPADTKDANKKPSGQSPDAPNADIEAGKTEGTHPANAVNESTATKPFENGGSTSMKRRRSSNNDAMIDVRTVDGTDQGAGAQSSSEPTRKKGTSNNDQAVDPSQVRERRSRRSNNDEFVDASDVGHSSNNEPPVDGAGIRSYRSRRSSSNNERPVDMFEIRSGPPPTDADVDAARKRAASLERKLEEVSKTHTALTETSRKLQQEIADLSAKNYEMQLE